MSRTNDTADDMRARIGVHRAHAQVPKDPHAASFGAYQVVHALLAIEQRLALIEAHLDGDTTTKREDR